MRFTPRAYQELIRNFALDLLARSDASRGNIFAGMGTGKTGASLDIYDTLRTFGEVKRALVLGPKRVVQSTWPDEVEKWCESFGHLKIAAAVGTPEQRRRAVMSKPDLLCINYDNAEWLVEGYGDDWPFDLVLADEATRLKGLRIALQTSSKGKQFARGQGSVRAKALSKVAHKHVRHWLNLTGSPAPNGLQDLWGIMHFVDGGRRLGRSFTAFQDRWFRTRPNADGYHQLEPLAHAKREIEDLIRDVCITIDARDWFDIKQPIEHHVMVDLPPKARKAYDEMENDLFAQIRAGGFNYAVEAFNSGSKLGKCLQIAHGAVYHDDEKNWVEVHDAKIDGLRSVVEETNGEPLLVRYTYRPDMARILKAFPRAKFLDDNPRTVKEFQQGRIPMLVTHAASAGHGLSLQDNCRVLVDFASDFNQEQDEQILERVGPTRQAQSGKDCEVYRYRLVARDTVEQHHVIPVLHRKTTMQDSFKAAMKRRH